MALPLPLDVPLGRVIASRSFAIRGSPKKKAELRIGTPVEFDGDAYCPVQLVGIGDEKIRRIFGVDTLQALQLAVRFLEPQVLRFGAQLRWQNEPAHQSLNSDSWAMFESAGLSEFLSSFAALCAEHAARARPAKGRRGKPKR